MPNHGKGGRPSTFTPKKGREIIKAVKDFPLLGLDPIARITGVDTNTLKDWVYAPTNNALLKEWRMKLWRARFKDLKVARDLMVDRGRGDTLFDRISKMISTENPGQTATADVSVIISNLGFDKVKLSSDKE